MTDTLKILKELQIDPINQGMSNGKKWFETSGKPIISVSPINNKELASVKSSGIDDYSLLMEGAVNAFNSWRIVPAPQRAEIVRQIGNKLRENKFALGTLVTLEMGKILQEGLGEVQEMIDICDFAAGQARTMNGTMLQSERSNHRLMEQYQPLGIVSIITSFNFPVAVFAWNAALALTAGNVVIWKPSSKTPLTAIATMKIIESVLIENNVPDGVINMIIGSGSELGDEILRDKRIPLVSVTGSTAVGRRAAEIVGKRLGKTILELGGNNAVIITANADLKLAVTSTVFGTVGTAGQRCTTTRRIIVHEKIYNEFKDKFVNAYHSIKHKIGDPLKPETLIGPLIDKHSVGMFIDAVRKVEEEGGKILFGGEILKGSGFESGNYVMPAIAEAQNQFKIVQEETFAPIVYLIKYSGNIENAIAINNDVPQGLSSAIFTGDLQEAEIFTSSAGSDCGIANVNAGTSGAEIGGAFGGEKDTGGGRESGSDAWKAYMRRQTSTINYSNELPLAQGIEFNF
jgi:aldehyde dehydrogenase (NAD+)